MQVFSRFAITVPFFYFTCPVYAADPPPIAEVKAQWEVAQDFKAKTEDGVTEYNVSGIACTKAKSASRACLIIDDELTLAERVEASNRSLRPTGTVELVSAAVPVGMPPDLQCEEVKKPNDLDGEAVAERKGVFYVIGSHGCGRNKGAFRASSFLLARVPPTGAPNLSYRVSEALLGCPVISGYYGKWLQDFIGKDGKHRADQNGMNIEGLAIADGRLWVGLRAPVLKESGDAQDSAYMVSMDVDAPFVVDRPLQARLHAVPLGDGRGIRDLAPLEDGRILILSGPRISAGSSYEISVFDPRNGKTIRRATLPPQDQAHKQEGLLVLRQSRDIVDLLVLQDGVKNGGPYEVQITMPARERDTSASGRVCS